MRAYTGVLFSASNSVGWWAHDHVLQVLRMRESMERELICRSDKFKFVQKCFHNHNPPWSRQTRIVSWDGDEAKISESLFTLKSWAEIWERNPWDNINIVTSKVISYIGLKKKRRCSYSANALLCRVGEGSRRQGRHGQTLEKCKNRAEGNIAYVWLPYWSKGRCYNTGRSKSDKGKHGLRDEEDAESKESHRIFKEVFGKLVG